MSSNPSVLYFRVFSLLVLLAWCACLLFPGIATAQALDAGAQWLEERQRGDGTFEPGVSIATALQADAEAELALLSFASNGSSPGDAVLDELGARIEEHTEFLALAIRQASIRDRTVPSLIEILLGRQNADGGFADAPGHPSSVQATAFALLALHASGREADRAIERAVAFLREVQLDNGGWRDLNEDSGVYTSALATRALSRYAAAFGLGPTLAGASEYLVSRREAAGGYGSSWETAQALLALLPVTPREEAFEPSLQWLIGQQADDGSWGGDVYSTALALRTLDTARKLGDGETLLPEEPDDGTVFGRVLSASDGQPVPRVRIGVESDSERIATTGSNGGFELVIPGDEQVTLIYSADGFTGATQSVQVARAGLVNLGDIVLMPEPDTGRVVGTVIDRETAEPLTDAEVNITGDSEALTGVDSAGDYAFVLPVGRYTITVSAPGYHPVSAEFDLAVAQTLAFSPGLVPESDPPLEDQLATVIGELRSADTGDPIAGASIASETRAVVSDETGSFRFDAIDAGEQEFTLEAEGYRALALSVILPPGGTADLGTIELEPIEIPEGVTLRGTVFDRASQAPVEGAVISGGGRSAVSGSDGRYRIEGLDVGQTTMSVSAEGYRNRTFSFTTENFGLVEFSIGLDSSDRGGLRLSGLRTDADSYEAHHEAELAIDLENAGPDTLVTRLYLAVFAADGTLLSEEPVTPVFIDQHADPDVALEEARIRFESGEQLTESFSWFTEARRPGDYELRVRAFEAFDGELLAERSRMVRVLPTRRVELLSVRPDPLYLPQGSSESLGFTVLLQHRSNEAFTFSGEFEMSLPDGGTARSESFSFELVPEQINYRLDIPGSSFTASMPGEHPIPVSVSEGPEPVALHGQPLFVAPGTRLEIEQQRSPGTVAPDGDHRIDIEIRLEGKEE